MKMACRRSAIFPGTVGIVAAVICRRLGSLCRSVSSKSLPFSACHHYQTGKSKYALNRAVRVVTRFSLGCREMRPQPLPDAIHDRDAINGPEFGSQLGGGWLLASTNGTVTDGAGTQACCS